MNLQYQVFNKLISINRLELLVIFFLITISSSIELKCKFVFHTDPKAAGYNCEAENNLQISHANTTIDAVTGTHIYRSKNSAVERLFLKNNIEMRFIPIGYSKFFSRLNNLWIANSPIESIAKTDFEKPENLNILGLRNTKLDAIDQDVFSGLVNIEELYLYNNLIRKIHGKAFCEMKHLRILKLDNNKLKYLPVGLFASNGNMHEVYINDNKLSIIDSDIFSALNHINKIELRRNFCIDKNFPIDFGSILDLNQAIVDECGNPMHEKLEGLRDLKSKSDNLISQLRSESLANEKLSRMDDELSKIKQENVDIQRNVSALQGFNEDLLIRNREMSEELIIVNSNHSIAQSRIEKLFNKTIDIELLLADKTRKLEESSKQNEAVELQLETHEKALEILRRNISNLSYDNAFMTESNYELEENLTQVLNEKDFLEILLAELNTNNSLLIKENENFVREIRELHNVTNLDKAQLSTEGFQTTMTNCDYRVVILVCVAIVALVSILIIALAIRKVCRGKVYETHEYNVRFRRKH